jgi:hypothetical protein
MGEKGERANGRKGEKGEKSERAKVRAIYYRPFSLIQHAVTIYYVFLAKLIINH